MHKRITSLILASAMLATSIAPVYADDEVQAPEFTVLSSGDDLNSSLHEYSTVNRIVFENNTNEIPEEAIDVSDISSKESIWMWYTEGEDSEEETEEASEQTISEDTSVASESEIVVSESEASEEDAVEDETAQEEDAEAEEELEGVVHIASEDLIYLNENSSGIFEGLSELKAIDGLEENVSADHVKDISYGFAGTGFTEADDLTSLSFSNVENATGLFSQTEIFDQTPIETHDVIDPQYEDPEEELPDDITYEDTVLYQAWNIPKEADVTDAFENSAFETTPAWYDNAIQYAEEKAQKELEEKEKQKEEEELLKKLAEEAAEAAERAAEEEQADAAEEESSDAYRVLVDGGADTIRDEDKVLSEYGGVYLLEYDSEEDAKDAYDYYKEEADGADMDKVLTIADEAAEPVQAEMPDVDPFEEAKAQDEVKTTNNTIALIDTGAEKGGNVIDSVSVIGENGNDENGHGTRMVKTIAGVNKDAKILSVKAMDADGRGSVATVYAAIRYAMEQGASIINLSMSGLMQEDSDILVSVIKEAEAAGITVVGAAGNNSEDVAAYVPGNIEEALIVGSCDEDGNKITISNYGKTVDYNVVSDVTSDAAAKMSAYVSMTDEIKADNKLVFETSGKTEEEPSEEISENKEKTEEAKPAEEAETEQGVSEDSTENETLSNEDTESVAEDDYTKEEQTFAEEVKESNEQITERAEKLALWVKYTLVSNTYKGEKTIDALFDTDPGAVIAQFPYYAPLYDEGGDYYIAHVDISEFKKSIGEITDCAFAKNNLEGEKLDDVVFDKETMTVKVPKKYFENTEDLFPVQAQFMCMYDIENPFSEILVNITNNTEKDVLSGEQIVKAYDLDTSLRIHVAKEGTDLQAGMFTVKINGEKEMLGSDLLTYEKESGDLVIAYSPINVKSAEIEINNIASLRNMAKTILSVAVSSVRIGPHGGNIDAVGTLSKASMDDFNVGASYSFTVTAKGRFSYNKAQAEANASNIYPYAYGVAEYSDDYPWAIMESGKDLAEGNYIRKAVDDPDKFVYQFWWPKLINGIHFDIERDGKVVNDTQMFAVACNHITRALEEAKFGTSHQAAKVQGYMLGHIWVLAKNESSNPENNFVVLGITTSKTSEEFYDSKGRKILQAGAAIYKFNIPPSGSVSVKKTSANAKITKNDSHYSLAGAVYKVYSNAACTKLVATLKTKADGTSNEVTLKPGTYYVRETKASPGYKLDASMSGTKEKKITVKAGKETVVTSKEAPYPKGRVKVVKKDAATGKPLTGAKFKIQKYSKSRDDYIDFSPAKTLTVDNAKGKISEWLYGDKDNPNAWFRVVETAAPDDAHPLPATAPAQSTTFKDGDLSQVLTFENQQQINVAVRKVDETGEHDLTGAEFRFRWFNGTNYTSPGILMTYDAASKRYKLLNLKVPKASKGKFMIEETRNPDGYESTWEKTATLKGTEGTVFYKATNYKDEGPHGIVSVIKTNSAGTKLPGATFKVYAYDVATSAAENTDVWFDDPVSTLEWDESSQTYVSGKLQRIDDPAAENRNDGRFKVVEVGSPDGHTNSGWSQEITVTASGNDEQTFEYTVVNQPNEIYIKKVDEDNVPINGVVFTIKHPDGTTEDKTTGTISTGSVTGAGLIHMTELEGGEWTYKEKSVPDDKYELDPQTYTFNVDEQGLVDGEQIRTVTVVNKIKDIGYPLHIIKTQTAATGTFYKETGFPKGTEFAVYEYDKNTSSYKTGIYAKIVYDETKSKFVDASTGEELLLHKTTDNQGKFQIGETASTPGYELTTVKRTIQIGTDEEYTVTFTNQPNTFTLTKTGATTSGVQASLPGVTFEFRNTDRPASEAKEFTTDANGKISLLGLAPGRWEYREVAVPAGYALDTTVHTFTVDRYGSIDKTTVSHKNYREKELKIVKKDAETGEITHPIGFPKGTRFELYEWSEENQSYSKKVYRKIIADEDAVDEILSSQDNLPGVSSNEVIRSSREYDLHPDAVAVIDTGASRNPAVEEYISVIGENAADDNGHGTRMIETILKETPDTKIVSIKALDENGEGTAEKIAEAIDLAVAMKVKAINFSVAAYETEGNACVRDALERAVEAGITVVGAAGNYGDDTRLYLPGSIDGVISVGAVDENDKILDNSNRNADKYVRADSTSEAAARYTGMLMGDKRVDTVDNVNNEVVKNAHSRDTTFRTQVDIIYYRHGGTGTPTIITDSKTAGTTTILRGYLMGDTAGTQNLPWGAADGKILYGFTTTAGGTTKDYFVNQHITVPSSDLKLYGLYKAFSKTVTYKGQNEETKGTVTYKTAGTDTSDNHYNGDQLDPSIVAWTGRHVIYFTGNYSNYKYAPRTNIRDPWIINTAADRWYDLQRDTVLQAAFKLNKYTINFDGNGATSGSMETFGDERSEYYIADDAAQWSFTSWDGAATETGLLYNRNYTLPTNKFKRTGYVFSGWNTKADGTGVSYANAATIRNVDSGDGIANGHESSTTLYAQWTPTLTVNYYAGKARSDSNGQWDGSSNLMDTLTYTYGQTGTGLATSGLRNFDSSGSYWNLYRLGYKPTKNWHVGSITGSTVINADTTFATPEALATAAGYNLASGPVTLNLYAEMRPNQLTINYYPGIATGDELGTWDGSSTPMETVVIGYDESTATGQRAGIIMNLADNGVLNFDRSSWKLTKTGYVPTNEWYVGSIGSNVLVNADTPYNYSQNLCRAAQLVDNDNAVRLNYEDCTLDLYAKMVPITYQIRYNKNASDATGTMSNTDVTYDEDATLASNGFSRSGYTFRGWATSPTGNVVYGNGETITKPNFKSEEGEIYDLYAVWGANTFTIKYMANGGSGTMYDTEANVESTVTLRSNAFTRANYHFIGWAETADGPVKYTNAQQISTSGHAPGSVYRLYAKWAINDADIFVDEETGLRPVINETDDNKGKFLLKEIAPSPGYIDDDREWEVALSMADVNGLITITMSNTPNHFKIVKKDDTGTKRNNVTFKVWYENQESAGTNYTTGSAAAGGVTGEINLDRLKPGTWHYREVSGPSDMVIDTTTVYDFTVDAKGHVFPEGGEVTKVNSKTPGDFEYKISKVSKGGDALSGVTFEVTKPDGTKITPNPVTDANGQIKLTGLAAGTYTYKEVSSKAGYVTDGTTYSFTILSSGKTQGNKAYNTVVNNPNQYDIEKLAASGGPLENVEFEIWKDSGTHETKVTDSNGKIHLECLAPGTWHIQEKSAPVGYVVDSTIRTFTVASNGLITDADQSGVTVGSLTVTNSLNKAQIKKQDENGNALSGVTFELSNEATGYREQKTTGSNGIAEWTGLASGTYTYEEIKGIDGYITNATGTITVGSNGAVSPAIVTAVNRKNKVEILKTDADTGAPLANVVFTLDYQGTGTFMANPSGYRTGADGKITFEMLPPGTYTLVESDAPDGYELDPTPHEFVVSDNGKISYNNGSEAETIAIPITNKSTDEEPKKGTLVITKKADGTGKLLTGAEFKVYEFDNAATGGPAFKATACATSTDKGDGTYEFPVFTRTTRNDGRFRVVETKAPDGYSTSFQREFIIAENGNDIQPFTMTAYNSPNELKIFKVDAVTQEKLRGAEFEFARQGETAVTYTTNSAGEISIPKLAPGTYLLKEKTAPEGYLLCDTIWTIQVGADGKFVSQAGDSLTFKDDGKRLEVTVKNQEYIDRHGYIHLKKEDGDGNDLKGASFRVDEYDQGVAGNYKPLTYLTYNEDTKRYDSEPLELTSDNLGKFKIVEEEAPEGYVLGYEAEVQIDPEGPEMQEFNLTAVNSPIEVKIHKVDQDDQPMENVGFTIYYESEPDTISDDDLEGNDYANDQPAIVDDEPDEDEIDPEAEDTSAVDQWTETTNASGMFSIQRARPGNYLMIETGRREGYAAEDGYRFTVTEDGKIEGTGGTTVTFDIPSNTITIKNIENSLKLYKKDADTNNYIGGAKFKYWYDGEAPTEVTIPAEGLELTAMKDGNLFVQETQAPPGGYVLDSNPVPVEIRNGKIRVSNTQEFSTTGEVVIYNDDNPGHITIEKIDGETNEVIKPDADDPIGPVFAAYPFTGTEAGTDNMGEPAQVNVYSDTPTATIAYNAATQKYEADLPYTAANQGKYLIKETRPKNGYYLIGEQHIAEIDITTQKNWEFTGSNAVKNYHNNFSIKKVDGSVATAAQLDSSSKEELDSVGLEGVGFDVWSSVDSTKVRKYTDAKGEITIENPLPGATYYYEEKEPLPGYDIDTTIHEAVADADGWINGQQNGFGLVVDYNSPVNIRVDKVDKDDHTKKLLGAEFAVYEWDNDTQQYSNTVKTTLSYNATSKYYETAANTLFKTAKNQGKFLVVETKAPAMYEVGWSAEVDAEDAVLENPSNPNSTKYIYETAENEKIQLNHLHTGGEGRTGIYILGSIMAAILAAAWYMLKKRRVAL